METRTKTAPVTDNAGLCNPSLPAKYIAQVRQDQSGCWTWVGSLRRTRYKKTSYCYGTYNCQLVHRLAYRALVGPIPEGLEIDHLCHNKLCVNPQHLEAVTHQQNCARRLKSGPYLTPGSIRDRRNLMNGVSR